MNGLVLEHLAATTLPENKALLADLQRLERELADGDRWRDSLQREAYRAEQLHEIQLQHWSRCRLRKEAIAEDLKRYSESWKRANERGPSERLLDLERRKAETALLDDKALQKELLEAAAADTPEARLRFSPERLTALSLEAAKRGSGTFEAVEAMKNCHAAKPWLNSVKGAELQRLEQAYEVEYGQAALGPSDEGTDFLGAFDISELLQDAL